MQSAIVIIYFEAKLNLCARPFYAVDVKKAAGICFLVTFFLWKSNPLRKHAYSNILKILPPKDKNSDIFHISTQNIDCEYSLEPPRRGGSNEYSRRSNEYSQSMFLGRNKKNNVYPCKPHKVGFKGVNII